MRQINNPMQIIQQFNTFRQNYRGNPEETVKNMINSGQLSQQQLNEAQAMAAQIMKIINK